MFLLDTNILFFMISDYERLTPKILKILEDKSNYLVLSSASLWEIEIKNAKRKISFYENLYDEIDYQKIEILNITTDHIKHTSKLPLIHSDPFDRMIISQALLEDLTLITSDKVFSGYNGLKLLLN